MKTNDCDTYSKGGYNVEGTNHYGRGGRPRNGGLAVKNQTTYDEECGMSSKEKPRLKPIKWAAYSQAEKAVEAGVRYGWHRAHKHETRPSEETIMGAIIDSVLVELSEAFDLE